MNNTVVILIHGYNVSDPRRTVGKLRPCFEELGCLVENYTYGYWPLPIQITRRNPKFAREVADRCKYWKNKGYQVYLAVHSNGAAIARIATEIHKAPIDRLLAFHPALRCDLNPCKAAEFVLVIHNGGDRAVVAGGLLGKISRFVMPKSWKTRPWGSMGQLGYSGKSKKVRNMNTGESSLEVQAWGHSSEFSRDKASYFLPMLSKMLMRTGI